MKLVILGLTGSIAMGKSKAAAFFARAHVPVHDADATVHRLLAKGGKAVAAVGRLFPGVVRDGAVDRQALGARVFADRSRLGELEEVLHPLVREEERHFLAAARRRRARVAVLDIPLFFETGGEKRTRASILVTAPPFIQEARALRRPGMTREKLANIRKKQMSEREKRRRADFIVPTGNGYRFTLVRLQRILEWAHHA